MLTGVIIAINVATADCLITCKCYNYSIVTIIIINNYTIITLSFVVEKHIKQL